MTTTVTLDELVTEFNAVVADTEQLLKSISAAGGERAATLRASVEQNLRAAKDRLAQLEKAVETRAVNAAKATDQYVRGHPWQSLAIAAGVFAIIGVVVGLLLNRK